MSRELVATVLIVDDDYDMRRYCATALQNDGYSTLSADNAATALDILRERTVDLLLADFHLAPPALRLVGGPRPKPFLNGLGLMQRALSAHPLLRVLIISADAERLITTRRLDPAKVPLLRKPFHVNELCQAVRATLHTALSGSPDSHQHTPAIIARAHPRFHVCLSVVFSGDAQGKGQVVDLSLGGCKVRTTCAVEPGAWLTLLLTLPSVVQPVKINVGVVRWAKAGFFGVEFRYVETPIHERLIQYLKKFHQ